MAEENKEKRSLTVCEGVSLFLGGIIVLGGIALVLSRFSQKAMHWAIQDQLVVAPDSVMLDAWVNPVVPVYMQFYVFNVTNEEDILRGERPVVTEHGPYTYRMLSPRYDIEFYPNHTVSFRNNNTLFFERNMSVGPDSDILYHINIPILTINQKLVESPVPGDSWLRHYGVYDKLLKVIGGEDLVVPHTVKQIIFGYQEPVMTLANSVMRLIGQEGMDPTFGPFHGFNNSDDGLFLVNTGEKNFSDFIKVERYNGETLLPYWTTDIANMLNGTDGSFLGPNVKRHELRYLYFPQMRRSLKVEYENDTSVKGVETFRYHFADDLLMNATACPWNKGFCVPRENCFKSGLLNVGSYGDETATMFISLPHFYNGDPSLHKDVVGMKPNKTLHDSFFHMEPMSGAVLLGQRRLQINVQVKGGGPFSQLSNVRPVFFPYFWLSGEAEVSDDVAENLRTAALAIKICGYIGYIVTAIGIVMLVATLLRRYHRRKPSTLASDEEPLVPEDDGNPEA